MRDGIHLGRIAGIDIFVDWSWLLIFLLVTWNLAAGVFPRIHPTWGSGLSLAVGLAASILFFASVLAHELAHSLVAKGRGLPVRRITLFIFGGVSNIEREPDSPLEEFLVAVVGPLTSILLGILFLVLGASSAQGVTVSLTNPMSVLARLNPLATLLLWLGPINILLGVFNLIPGFPLDGGRVLRSILWAFTNNLRTATHWATLIGQAIAWLFIIGGIAMIFGFRLPFFGTGFVSGLWLAFIGWFLNNAATAGYRQTVLEEALEGVTVGRLMRQNVPGVTPNMTVSQLVDDYFAKSDERAFPVLDGDNLLGMVSLEDVHQTPRQNWDTTLVSQIMTPADQLDVVNPAEGANEALHKLAGHDLNHVPVVQNGHLVGMLRQRDILRWMQLHSDLTAG